MKTKREEMIDHGFKGMEGPSTIVNVRWWDGYLEVFECTQVRQGAHILWMRLVSGENRTIPLQQVRWFSTDPESHASNKPM